MGDDAEYQTRSDSEAAEPEDLEGPDAEDEPCRPLLCWVDDELGYIWDWEPEERVLGVFADLHDYERIGTMTFLSSGVPSESEVPDGLSAYRAAKADDATHEVIVLTARDIEPLVDAAAQMRDKATDIREELLAGMLEAMVLFMEAEPERDLFVFARTL